MSAENPNPSLPLFPDDGEPHVITTRSASYPVFREIGGSLLVIGLTLALTLAAFVWKGYDLRLFSTVPIGDRYDTLGNAADIEQAMKNLITTPLDLSRYIVYYPEPHAFAYTIAPYGIAAPLLPVYLLTGRNIALTVNLYFIATFVLSAWGLYLLVRYLFAAPVSVGIFAGLMMAFAQYRLVHVPHVESLSTQWLIFGLYALHHFLDRKSLGWALLLGLFFWLTFFTSGYLGYMFIFGGVIIALLTLVWRRHFLNIRMFVYALIVGAVVAAVGYPFLAMRLSGVSTTSYDLGVIRSFSASIPNWFAGSSLFYRLFTPFVPEATVLIGFVPAVLTLLAWRYRRDERAARTPSPLKPWQLVLMYSLIVTISYVLTLGPDLAPGIASPYRLLLALPGFSAIRVPARFIILAVVGTAVLSAFTLTALSRRSSPGRFRIVLAVCSLLLFVELLPYSSLLYPGSSLYQLNLSLPEVPAKAYAWLDQQPISAALQYPLSPEYDNLYAYEVEKSFHSSMVNGTSSFYPDWYGFVDWKNFPDDAGFDLLQSKHVPYLMVHHRFLDPEQLARVNQRLEQFALAGRIAYVTTLDDVDIYRLFDAPPSSVRLEFNLPISGTGWNAPEHDNRDQQLSFAWSSSATPTLDVPAPALSDTDLALQFRISGAMPHVLDIMKLTVDDQPIALSAEPDGSGATYSGTLPRNLLGPDAQTLHLSFITGEPIAPADVNSSSSDRRKLGAQFDWLSLTPRSTLQTFDLNPPLDGSGWEATERTDEGAPFHWMLDTSATLNLGSVPIDDLGLLFRIDQWMSDDILESLTLKANGQPVALARVDGSTPMFVAAIPRGAVVLDPEQLVLTFGIDRTMSPHEGNPSSTDNRQLGVALSGLWTYPLHDVQLSLGSLPTGPDWSAPLTASTDSDYRWMTAPQSTLALALPTGQPVTIDLVPLGTPDADITRHFSLTANAVPVPLSLADVKGRTVLRGVIPAEALPAGGPGAAQLVFTVDQTRPLTGTDSPTAKAYGLAFSRIQVHDNAPRDGVQLDFGPKLQGSGWYDQEVPADAPSFRWMKAPTATVEFVPPDGRSFVLQVRVQSGITPEILSSLTLKVNGQAVDFAPLDSDPLLYQATVPRRIVALDPAKTTLAFSVSGLASPQSLGQGDDPRQLGVAINSLTVFPADEVSLNFDKTLVGMGWQGAEQDSNGAFQWMAQPSATATVPFRPSGMDEQVVFRIAHSMTPEILNSLTLSVNGDPVTLQHGDLQLNDSLWWGTIPAATLDKSEASGQLAVTFNVAKTVSPESLGQGTDTRTLGVAPRWLIVTPGLTETPAGAAEG